MKHRALLVRVFWWSSALSLLSLVALFAYAPIFAVDFFWLLKLGELVAVEGEIPRTDRFSAVHPDAPYVQFQWLWELLAHLVHDAGGLTAVRVMQVVVLSASFVVLGAVGLRAFRHRSLAFFFASLALVWFEDRFQTRPSSTLLGFLALSLPWLMDESPAGGWRELMAVALLACIWSNIHAGEALLLPLCLAARVGGGALERHAPRSQLRVASQRLACALVGMAISPVLLPGLLTWMGTIGPQLSTGNREWLPSYTMLRYGAGASELLIAFGPTLVALGYVVEQTWVRVRCRARGEIAHPAWSEWLLCAGLLVLAHAAVRNVFLSLVPVAFLLRRSAASIGPVGHRLAIAGAFMMLVAATHNHVFKGYGGLAELAHALPNDLAPASFPEELADFMHEAGIEGAALNDGRWGGYLIFRTWPRCRYFVDSRQNLTSDMWPIFLGAQSALNRPRSMEYAFRRWGIELSVYRGPTFPTILARGRWQLLYKAGDQELYQHLDGEHARTNIARAQDWLAKHAHPTDAGNADLSVSATLVGARRWLGAPAQRWLLDEARARIASGSAAERVRGLTTEAKLFYEAGLYEQSLARLHAVIEIGGDSADNLYRAALASYAVAKPDDARRFLADAHKHLSELTRPQIERLGVLQGSLARK